MGPGLTYQHQRGPGPSVLFILEGKHALSLKRSRTNNFWTVAQSWRRWPDSVLIGILATWCGMPTSGPARAPLMATFVAEPPAGVDVVAFFVNRRDPDAQGISAVTSHP